MVWLNRAFAAAVVCYWGLMFTMTHLPKPPSLGPDMGDKAQHFLSYAVLAALLYAAVWMSRPGRRWPAIRVLAVVFAYGAVDEWTQPLVGRSCELRDWLADATGAAVAVGAMIIVRWLVQSAGRVASRSPAV